MDEHMENARYHSRHQRQKWHMQKEKIPLCLSGSCQEIETTPVTFMEEISCTEYIEQLARHNEEMLEYHKCIRIQILPLQ